MFSVTGVPESVFYIALAGLVIVPFRGVSAVTEKMLDGMGKSFYELLLILGGIVYEILIVYQLAPIFNQGVCVLLGVLIGEVTLAVLYYILLKYFFKNLQMIWQALVVLEINLRLDFLFVFLSLFGLFDYFF